MPRTLQQGGPLRKAPPPATSGRTARYSEAGAAVFQLLQELDRAEAIWGGAAISRGRLSVLRTLAMRGPMTASDVARARHASRQGVQRLIDALRADGWVEASPNPRHRRSPLLRLTPAGLAAHQRLAAEEAERLNDLARGLPPEDVRRAARVLRALRIRGAARPG